MSSCDAKSISTFKDNDSEIEQFTQDRLMAEIETLKEDNKYLEMELSMFERYLTKMTDKEIQWGTPDKKTSGKSPGEKKTDISDTFSVKSGLKRRSKSRSSTLERLNRLTTEQKYEIAMAEYDQIFNTAKKNKKKYLDELESHINNIKAYEIRLAEIETENVMLDKMIDADKLEAQNQNLTAEKIIKYFSSVVKYKSTLIDKTKLKKSSSRTQHRKLIVQLRQKEETGEVLQEVDFLQLKIENSQFLNKIDDKNQELLHLKILSGKTLQNLNNCRKKLNSAAEEFQTLESQIAQKHEMIKRVEGEIEETQKEEDLAEGANKKMKSKLEEYVVPEIMDYVRLTKDLKEKEQICKEWERKAGIANVSLKLREKKWKR